MQYPKIFEDLMQDFKKLPGVGDKTAERYAFTISSLPEEEIKIFSNNLIELKKNIRNCSVCGILTDKEVCEICNSKSRDNSIICVVEDSKNAYIFERGGNFNGKYHVLNGLINPIEDVNPEDINIFSLINNRINDKTKEVIIALSPSIEGQTTSLYIQKLLEKKNIKISRLSYGITMGSDIEYLDPIMISKALEDRKYI